MNVDIVTILVGGHGSVQVFPPRVQQPLFADETEPWREQKVWICHHVDQSLSCDPFHGIHFIRMRLDSQIVLGFDAEEQNVVNLVLAPWA